MIVMIMVIVNGNEGWTDGRGRGISCLSSFSGEGEGRGMGECGSLVPVASQKILLLLSSSFSPTPNICILPIVCKHLCIGLHCGRPDFLWGWID